MIVLSACLKNILTDNGILKAEPLVVCGAKPCKHSESTMQVKAFSVEIVPFWRYQLL